MLLSGDGWVAVLTGAAPDEVEKKLKRLMWVSFQRHYHMTVCGNRWPDSFDAPEVEPLAFPRDLLETEANPDFAGRQGQGEGRAAASCLISMPTRSKSSTLGKGTRCRSTGPSNSLPWWQSTRGSQRTVVRRGAMIFQDSLPLEAVGIDLDGRIRPIKDLSHAPMNRAMGRPDWTHEPPNWPSINSETFPELDVNRAKSLATRWLYRLWKISVPYSGAFLPGGETGTITRIDGIHLYDRRVDTWVSPDDATQLLVGTPELWGTFDQGHAELPKETAGSRREPALSLRRTRFRRCGAGVGHLRASPVVRRRRRRPPVTRLGGQDCVLDSRPPRRGAAARHRHARSTPTQARVLRIASP